MLLACVEGIPQEVKQNMEAFPWGPRHLFIDLSAQTYTDLKLSRLRRERFLEAYYLFLRITSIIAFVHLPSL